MPKAIIIGAGISGATAARLLLDRGWEVTVFESNSEVGGSCRDHLDTETGSIVHDHGPHAFHTKSKTVWEFVNRFDTFLPFSLTVHAALGSGDIIPLPFNLNSQAIVGDWTGERIIEEVFKTYSNKMWGVPWESLPASVTARVPKLRDSWDTRYHLDRYQGIPTHGYTNLIRSMLSGAEVVLSASESDWWQKPRDLLIYTGKADTYFQSVTLPWRSLEFTRTVEKPTPFVQLNACNTSDKWHRQVDHSKWPNSRTRDGKATVIREVAVPHREGENVPYYPEPHLVDRDALRLLRARMKAEKNTMFLGRLATYKYISMNEAVAAAMRRIESLCQDTY